MANNYWLVLSCRAVDFLAESLSVGLMSIGTVLEILSPERLLPFAHFNFHALLPALVIRVMDLACRRTSVGTVVKLVKDHMLSTGATWVGHAHMPDTASRACDAIWTLQRNILTPMTGMGRLSTSARKLKFICWKDACWSLLRRSLTDCLNGQK